MPYLVPAWALRTIGTSTIRLARKMVRTACHQFMPPAISADARVYVGMQAARDTHRAAMSFRPQVRSAGAVGARSRLAYGEPETSAGAGRQHVAIGNLSGQDGRTHSRK